MEPANMSRTTSAPDDRPAQWRDPALAPANRPQGSDVTILFGGLTACHDALIEAGLAGLGYRALALPCPDQKALQYGKEFGNRGQCNPTYFTVGNLLRYLIELRDREGMSTQDIIDRHVFVTMSTCGPCRFGTYTTEYRKALRDAGFTGFRVIGIKQEEGGSQLGTERAIRLDAGFYLTGLKCAMAGDVLNALAYQIRPYEIRPGGTDAAVARCLDILCDAFRRRRSVMLALRRCRRELNAIEVDRLRVKPKVAIIGEFWAMTTEGDGNYRLQRFLESEGAEVDLEPLTTWVLYDIWCVEYDTRQRMMLRRRTEERHPRESATPLRTLFLAGLTSGLVKCSFAAFARAAGLRHAGLPDMEELAQVSHGYYPNQLRGGEGHLEVGKVILATRDHTADLILSVKPFGCMPSSAVSDGIQSLVTARFSDVNFLPVETSGDGATNAYSRVQMALFKARSRAEMTFGRALAETELTPAQATARVAAHPDLRRALYNPPPVTAVTAANMLHALT
jgi:predicted nucleotide-binding protein (sugar kinase/HSP70/actin superfamily)